MRIIDIISKAYNKIFNIDDIEKIFYVGGSDNLPAPLSSKEEEEAIKKLDKGDDDARKLLVEHNLIQLYLLILSLLFLLPCFQIF